MYGPRTLPQSSILFNYQITLTLTLILILFLHFYLFNGVSRHPSLNSDKLHYKYGHGLYKWCSVLESLTQLI
jgi:hypothetical protein